MVSPFLRRMTAAEADSDAEAAKKSQHEMTNTRTQAHSRRRDGVAEVTDVTTKAKWLSLALFAFTALVRAQPKASSDGSTESLYLRLRSVGMDTSRVYAIRHA